MAEKTQYVPYIEAKILDSEYEDFFAVSYEPLKPTGLWKLESGPYYKNKMFIQHKGLIFKRWISEDSIVFRPAKSVEIFDCRANN